MSMKNRAYEILERPSPADRAARRWNGVIVSAILVNTAAMIVETVDSLQARYASLLLVVEIVSVTIFTAEYVLRLWVITCSQQYSHPIRGRLRYAITPGALIDLIAIAPSLVAARIDLRFVRLARLARLARALKVTRYTRALSLLVMVARQRASELLTAGGIILALLVAASSLMYFAEHDAQPDVFSSIPTAMWWGVTTLTTVGYGDVYPVTGIGRVLAGIVALLGIGAFALPTSILGAGFLAEFGRRSQIAEDQCPTCGARLSKPL